MNPSDFPFLSLFIAVSIIVFTVVLSVFWILFPILVNAKLKTLIGLQADTVAALEAIRDEIARPRKTPSGVVEMPPSALGER